MSAETSPSIPEIVSQLVLAEDLDKLHLAVTHLLEKAESGDLDAILEQNDKNAAQKKSALEKEIADLPSPVLQEALHQPLTANNLDFFSEKYLPDFLHNLQHAAEKIEVVRLTVACRFKPADIKDMAQLLGERVGHPIAFTLEVDNSLIGGVIIQHGTYISDYSLRSRLNQFREHWRGQMAALENIQA